MYVCACVCKIYLRKKTHAKKINTHFVAVWLFNIITLLHTYHVDEFYGTKANSIFKNERVEEKKVYACSNNKLCARKDVRIEKMKTPRSVRKGAREHNFSCQQFCC